MYISKYTFPWFYLNCSYLQVFIFFNANVYISLYCFLPNIICFFIICTYVCVCKIYFCTQTTSISLDYCNVGTTGCKGVKCWQGSQVGNALHCGRRLAYLHDIPDHCYIRTVPLCFQVTRTINVFEWNLSLCTFLL